MKRARAFQAIDEQTAVGNAGLISCTFASEPILEPLSPLETPGNAHTFPDHLLRSEQSPNVKQTRLHPVEIEDPVFEETYTAYVTKRSRQWCGWIPDVPEVVCEAKTEAALLKTLADKLHEALAAEEEAWKHHFFEAVKAGMFEPLREEALADVRAGRFKDL